MRSGRFSDTTLVVAMLSLVALAAIAAFGAQWMINRGSKTDIERALERQAAVLIEEPNEFVANPAQCGDSPAAAMALDFRTGEVLWERELAGSGSFQSLLTVLADGSGGHVALHLDVLAQELPPSVMAIDVSTGDLRWQRFLDAEIIDRFAVSETELVFRASSPDVNAGGRPTEYAVSLNADGRLDDWFLDGGDFMAPQADLELGPGYRFADLRGQFATMVGSDGEDLTNGAPSQVVFLDPWSTDRLMVHETGSGDIRSLDGLPVDGEFNYLGQTSSLAAEVHVIGDHVLAVIGSEQGPNTRVAVLDRISGTVLWSLDDLRAAALAEGQGNDLVVYDKRNDEPIDSESTRDLFLVSADDPEIELWSTPLSVNADGGNGFLGTVEGDPVFAVVDDDLSLRFLLIEDRDDVPELLDAAEGFGSATGSWKYHIDGEVMAAVTDDGVVLQSAGEEPQLVPTTTKPNQIVRVGDALLINQWNCPGVD